MRLALGSRPLPPPQPDFNVDPELGRHEDGSRITEADAIRFMEWVMYGVAVEQLVPLRDRNYVAE